MDQNSPSVENSVSSTNTTSPSNSGVVYASFWVRAAALVIDSFIVGSVTFALAFAAGLNSALTPGFNTPVEILTTIISVVFSISYYIGMVWKKGATLGKMAVGIVIKRTDGSSLSLKRTLLREIVGKFVSNITLCIGYLVAVFNPKKQGFHDMIADTVVIDLHPENKKTGWKIFGVFFTVVVPLLILAMAFIVVSFIVGFFGGSNLDLFDNNGDWKEGERPSQVQILKEVRDNAVFYATNNETLKGYEATTNVSSLDSSLEEDVITKISADGKKAAFYIPTRHVNNDVQVVNEVNMFYCADIDIDKVSLANTDEFIKVEESFLLSPTAYMCRQ